MTGQQPARVRASVPFLWASVTVSVAAGTYSAVAAMVHGDAAGAELWAALIVAEVTGATAWTSIRNGRRRALGDQES